MRSRARCVCGALAGAALPERGADESTVRKNDSPLVDDSTGAIVWCRPDRGSAGLAEFRAELGGRTDSIAPSEST